MSSQPILEIKDLTAGVEDKQILRASPDDLSRRSSCRHGADAQRIAHSPHSCRPRWL